MEVIVVCALALGVVWAMRGWLGRPGRALGVAIVAELVVIVSVVNVTIQTSRGQQVATTDVAAGIWIVGVPAVLCILLTGGRMLRPVTSIIGVLAWAPLNIEGDFSCTDCAFAFLWPLLLAVPQIGLLIISVATRVSRRTRRPDTTVSTP